MRDQLEWAQVCQLVSPVHPRVHTKQQPRLQIHYLGVLGWLYGYQTPGSTESRICGHCKKSPLKHVLPQLPVTPSAILEEITFCSIKEYLEHRGHVLLPSDMLSAEDIASTKDDPLFRANLLLGYWHGSKSLPCKRKYVVSNIYIS